MDTISKLEALEHIPDGWKKYKMVVIAPLKTWQRDSLKFLGVPEENIVEAPNQNIEIENCLVLSPRRNHLRVSIDNINWLKNKLLPFADTTISASERIFISRKKNEGRYLINEDEVTSLLSNEGYLKCYLDEFNLSQQIGLFSNANKIIGIHGAGLFNMIFSKNPMVSEIFSDRIHPFYLLLCNAIDGKYDFLVGQPEEHKHAINRKAFILPVKNLKYI